MFIFICLQVQHKQEDNKIHTNGDKIEKKEEMQYGICSTRAGDLLKDKCTFFEQGHDTEQPQYYGQRFELCTSLCCEL